MLQDAGVFFPIRVTKNKMNVDHYNIEYGSDYFTNIDENTRYGLPQIEEEGLFFVTYVLENSKVKQRSSVNLPMR